MDKIIEFAHKLLLKSSNKNIAVDMTTGNGNDTLFLCQNFNYVYGFDIQKQAIINTDNFLKSNNFNNYKLINESHEYIDKYIDDKVDVAIYNLGYLPSGDKNITTMVKSTLLSLDKLLLSLNDKGLICIVVYPGHEEGKHESAALDEYVSKLDQKVYDVITYRFVNQINNPPYLIAIERR